MTVDDGKVRGYNHAARVYLPAVGQHVAACERTRRCVLVYSVCRQSRYYRCGKFKRIKLRLPVEFYRSRNTERQPRAARKLCLSAYAVQRGIFFFYLFRIIARVNIRGAIFYTTADGIADRMVFPYRRSVSLVICPRARGAEPADEPGKNRTVQSRYLSGRAAAYASHQPAAVDKHEIGSRAPEHICRKEPRHPAADDKRVDRPVPAERRKGRHMRTVPPK